MKIPLDTRVAGGLTHSLAQVRAYGVGTPDHGLNTYSLIRSPDEARRPLLVSVVLKWPPWLLLRRINNADVNKASSLSADSIKSLTLLSLHV